MTVEEQPSSNDESQRGEEPMPEGTEPPPRGAKAMAVVRWVIVAVTASLAAFTWLSFAGAQLGGTPAATSNAPKYQCPMHPQIVSDTPGECPICHMSLEPIAPDRASDAASSSAPTQPVVDASAPRAPQGGRDGGAAAAFACPMHSDVTSDKPGRCPICKMALEPVAMDAAAVAATPPPGTTPPGTIAIDLALDRVQAIGVRTAAVEEQTLTSPIRSTAIVMPSEQGAAEVHVRAPGFVEGILVDQTGVQVGKGQTMLSIYSPEILQAQHELLATRSWMADGGAGSSAAQAKLELLGVTAKEIARVLERREAIRAVAVVAPRGGVVTKKNVVLGSYVTPETSLYEIQDLSRVYVVADVFAGDAARVHVGGEAKFVPSSHPADAVVSKIDLVYPAVSPEARTRRVRMQVPNPFGRTFAPGEYGALEVATTSRRALTIPRDALVDTGAAVYVFVVEDGASASDHRRYAPRVVVTSGAPGDRVAVEAGLHKGDRVVSGATFLIDSESRLQASIASQTGQPKP